MRYLLIRYILPIYILPIYITYIYITYIVVRYTAHGPTGPGRRTTATSTGLSAGGSLHGLLPAVSAGPSPGTLREYIYIYICNIYIY